MPAEKAQQDSADGSEQGAGVGLGIRPLESGERKEQPHYKLPQVTAEQLARARGWLSLGLGLAGTAAPGSLARLAGLSDDERTRTALRMVGVSHLASGAGMLAQPQPDRWLWTSLLSDAIDLGLLGLALRSKKARRNRVAGALAAVFGMTALDVLNSQLPDVRPALPRFAVMRRMKSVRKAITINRPLEEVYRFWSNFENLPLFLKDISSVEITGAKRSHWRAKGPGGKVVWWDVEIIDERPDELIAWQSLGGANRYEAGVVRFNPAPGGRGTEVHLELHDTQPSGVIGALSATLLGSDAGLHVHDELRVLKQVLEVGEIVRSDSTLDDKSVFQRPAQPPAGKPSR